MKARERFDLVRDVLDRELVDADGLPCGTVDDVELEGGPGGTLRIAALLAGPGVLRERLPGWLARVARRVGPGRRVRVAWDDVASIGHRIVLARTATALGLGVAERRVGRWIAKVPGS